MVCLNKPKLAPYVSAMDFKKEYTIQDVKVILFPANHTPGSSMFLFILPSGKRILHTGDFRAEDDVLSSIAEYAPMHHLFIDCTFATFKLPIPKREVCVAFIIETILSARSRNANALVWIGTYTHGKEDLVFNVASSTHDTIYAPKQRLKVLRALTQAGSPYEGSALLTDQEGSSNLHLVPISTCKLDSMLEYAAANSIDTVIAFQATGWAARPGWNTPAAREVDGHTALLYTVPYSDHCNLAELNSFVKLVHPTKLTPTTARNDKEAAKIRGMFNKYMSKAENKMCLDYYFKQP